MLHRADRVWYEPDPDFVPDRRSDPPEHRHRIPAVVSVFVAAYHRLGHIDSLGQFFLREAGWPIALGEQVTEGLALEVFLAGSLSAPIEDSDNLASVVIEDPKADGSLHPRRAVGPYPALFMPDEGVGDIGERSLQIVLESRSVPDYDVGSVVVVFDDPAAVELLGFLAIPGETLPLAFSIGVAVGGRVSAVPRLRLFGELWDASPCCCRPLGAMHRRYRMMAPTQQQHGNLG